jgi:hypothetical protein
MRTKFAFVALRSRLIPMENSEIKFYINHIQNTCQTSNQRFFTGSPLWNTEFVNTCAVI